MRKNLVILHLESVSQSAFWQFMADLPELWKLSARSGNFRRFYTASTSSVMSMCEMLHGDSAELDHNPVFPRHKDGLAGRSSNLFQVLLDRGYATKGVQYGSFCLGDAPNNFWGIWPYACGQFIRHDKIEEFHGDIRHFIRESKAKNRPFALYHWNMSTHIRNDPESDFEELGFAKRFKVKYRLLDESVKRLLDDLAEAGVLDNTIIAAYGDHGDDFWGHGLSRGRTHVIEPYATVCWTPFFIFNNGFDRGIFDNLASNIDIKPTLLSMLFPDMPAETGASLFAGVNLISGSRKTAFSQSIFALQLEHSDPCQAVIKSYAVTNGEIRLMASSGGNKPEEGGMELFLEQWDFGNTKNLLDFFQLDKNGRIAAFDSHGAVHPHFTMSFTRQRIVSLAGTYDLLRQNLADFIAAKEREAMKISRDGKKQLFPMEMFKVVRKKRR
ncbi:MAG: sulfatase-like hydrolase/transferase [Planctomycetota bacterium]|nr:sulfatase-like hydrolase/transferase [Planctomycetota bacterium]